MERLNPKVLIVFFIKNFITTVHVIPIWFIAVSIFENIWPDETTLLPFEQIVFLLYGAGIIFSILLLLACYYWAWLSFMRYGYQFGQDGFHIYKGVLLQRDIVIPYTTIEHIEVYLNPLVVRTLGLYNLRIKTREQINTEGIFRKSTAEIIPGLTQEAVQHLRNELIKASHIQIVQKKFFDPISGKYR